MNNFITIFKKELKDIFRDKKTILFTILLPVIIYPALFKVMSIANENTSKEATKEINIIIQGDNTSAFVNVLKNQPNIYVKEFDDPTKALKEGKVQLILNVPNNFDTLVDEGKPAKLELLVDDESSKSTIATSIVTELSNQYTKKIISSNLTANGINPSILDPYTLEVKSGINKDSQANGFTQILIGMIPSFIIIFMVTPTISMAADLGAGEKERNTFEPLLSTSVSRNAILFGKMASMFVVALIALSLSLISFWFSMKNFMSMGQEFNITLTPTSVILTLIVSLLVLVTICAIEMALSIYARSEKEAASYLTGILMPVFILSYIPMMMDAKSVNQMLFHVPITNTVCLIKEFLVGIFNTQHILFTIGWNITYIVAAVIFVKYMFSREEVIFRT